MKTTARASRAAASRASSLTRTRKPERTAGRNIADAGAAGAGSSGFDPRSANRPLAVRCASCSRVASMVSTRISRARWARNRTRPTTLTTVNVKASDTDSCGTKDTWSSAWVRIVRSTVIA
jgi:hypothetical protein